jgi:hypothetical protein
MCIAVRFITPEFGARPWDPTHLVINVPRALSISAIALIVRETLCALGVAQDLSRSPVCFCGEPVELPEVAPTMAGTRGDEEASWRAKR